MSGKLYLPIILALLTSNTHVVAADDPSDFERGLGLRMEGKNAQAVAAFRKVHSDSPHYVRALVQMGATLEDLGKRREASNVYQQALTIDPKNASAARNLEQLRSAIMTESLTQTPNPAKEELIRSGFRALEAGDFKRALEVFRLSRGLFLNDPRPLFYSALTLERQGNFKGAIALYERTIESFPDYVPARINHVLNLLGTGDREGATKSCRKGVEIVPEDRRLRSLGDLLTRLGPQVGQATAISKGIKGP
ncbi:MAG: tetratricopeptide repeat protein [Desulfomonile tiedjei]|uniref:Tetratricopeptide repeat protein n=1 Tax=Desulfomonile tiedjei TaxID=2358 RepID=A0A9D6V156_9BACT|nr:tetratricopeptide repeat protein [Desulfomonile tiedjei]